MKTAVIILGHGSRRGGADETVKRVAAEVKKSGGPEIVEYAFLRYVKPAPQEALEYCIRQRVKKVVIVPFFMQPGAHVTKDIPAFVEKAKKEHPDIDIMTTDFVGSHALMVKIVEDLVKRTK
jgi:sirohydrochlorin ferrochelatase